MNAAIPKIVNMLLEDFSLENVFKNVRAYVLFQYAKMPSNHQSAQRRAFALADLHHTNVDREGNTYKVDASEFYKPYPDPNKLVI